MKVLLKLTLKYLGRNKIRTLLTLLGLVISITMIVFTFTSIVSLNETILQSVISNSGFSDFSIRNANDELFHKVITTKNVNKLEKTYDFKAIAEYYSNLNGQEAMASLKLKDVEPQYFSRIFKNRIVEGRLPEKEGEAIVSYDLKLALEDLTKLDERTVAHTVSYKDYLRFTDEFRFFDGDYTKESRKTIEDVRKYNLSEYVKRNYGEELRFYGTEEYTIVGYYSGSSYSNGIMIEEGIDESKIIGINYFEGEIIRYRKINDRIFNLEGIYNRYDLVRESTKQIQNIIDESSTEAEYYNNEGLISLKHPASSNSLFLYVIISVIIIGLVILSVAVFIYNIFSTNYADNFKDIGLLKVVGLTKNQLFMMVILEGLFYFIIALPVGYLLGNLAVKIVFAYMHAVLNNSIAGVYVYLVYKDSKWVLILTSIISALLIFLSKFISSKIIFKTNPIDNINYGYVESNLKVRSGSSIKRILGYEGFLAIRNVRRNRRKFIITTLSITMSIVIFVITTFLTSTLDVQVTKTVKRSENSYGILTSNNKKQTIDMLKDLNKVKGIGAINEISYGPVLMWDENGVYNNKSNVVIFLEDSSYNRVCKEFTNADGIAFVLKSNSNINRENQKVKIGSINLSKNLDENYSRLNNLQEDSYYTYTTKVLEKDNPEIMSYLKNSADYDNVALIKKSEYEGIYNNNDIKVKNVIEISKNSEYPMTSEQIKAILTKYPTAYIDQYDEPALKIVKLYSYGFILVIIIIAILNVINTTYNNIMVRRREIAFIKAVGIEKDRIKKIVILESILSVIIAALVSFVLIFLILTLIYFLLLKGVRISKSTIFLSLMLYTVSVLTSLALVYITSSTQYNSIENENITNELKAE